MHPAIFSTNYQSSLSQRELRFLSQVSLCEEIVNQLESVSSSLDAALQTASKVSASSEFQDVNSCSFDKDLKQNRSAKRDGRQMAGAVVP